MDYCHQNGILLELTIPNTPQQNGVAERANRTLTERMRAMMKDANCSIALWGEAVCTAAYCLNRTLTSANGGFTPIQAFEGTVPDVSHTRIFYSDAYIHRSKSDGAKKLGDRARLVKFVGYPEGVSGYKFYDPLTRTTILSRSARFLDFTTSDPTPAPHNPSPEPPNTFDDDDISIMSNSDHLDDFPPSLDASVSDTPNSISHFPTCLPCP